jgi:hypothetical protein
MHSTLRSIAIGILRFVASGAISAGIGLALAYLSKVAFSIAYLVPGCVIAGLLFAALLGVTQALGYPMNRIFGEQGIDGPSIFAGVMVLGGFLFWWAAIFLAWTR